jgi:hypothetical protein
LGLEFDWSHFDEGPEDLFLRKELNTPIKKTSNKCKTAKELGLQPEAANPILKNWLFKKEFAPLFRCETWIKITS